MPYKKKNYRKKNRKFKKRSMFKQAPSYPIGKTFKFVTRYVDLSPVINPPVGASATHVFSLNGLFDPDITGVGHQPLGFDQIMPLYDHYCVIGARARVTFTNRDQGQQSFVLCQIKDTNAVSLLTNDILENGKTKYKVLGVEGSGDSSGTIVVGMSTSRFFGKKVLQDDTFQGTIGTNPADQVYLHCIAQSVDPAADIGSLSVAVEIEYVAILTEPKQLIGS